MTAAEKVGRGQREMGQEAQLRRGWKAFKEEAEEFGLSYGEIRKSEKVLEQQSSTTRKVSLHRAP